MQKITKKWLSMATVAVLTLGLLSGCGTAPTTPSNGTSSTPAKQVKVGFSLSTLNNPYFVTVKQGAEAEAKTLGYTLTVADAQNESSKQASDIENFISQKVDMIIVNPVDGQAVVPAILEANKANILVITWNRKANGGTVAAHISFDEIKTGTMQGEEVAKVLNGKGNIAELLGTTGTDVAADRSKGFEDTIKKSPGIAIVAKLTAKFDRATGMKVMEDILQAHPDINAVFAANDEMALGAISAIEAAGKSAQIKVFGVDATDEGLAALKAGKLVADVSLPPYFFGKQALEVTKQVLDGTLKEKTIIVPSTLVTKENVDQLKTKD